MRTMTFNETEEFFEQLDAAVKDGEKVRVLLSEGKPDFDSKLWPRLRKCDNWSEVEDAFKDLKGGKTSPLAKILAETSIQRLTGGEVALLAWIGTLLIGLFAYAIYKGKRVKFVGTGSVSKDGRPQVDVGFEIG